MTDLTLKQKIALWKSFTIKTTNETDTRLKSNGGDDYFIIVDGLRFKFNCVGELMELTIKGEFK